MYAVIRAGGKQHKVAPGDVIEVELVKSSNGEVEFTPLLVVDDKGTVTSAKDSLAKAKVTGKVLGETKGEKLHVYKFKSKSGYRRHTGHRQKYSQIEISDIKLSGGKSRKSTAKKDKEEDAGDGT